MYKKQSKTIEEMHEAKIKRYDASSIGAQIGGLMHDVIPLIIAKYDLKEMEAAEIEGKIIYWLDALYDIAEAKKQPQPVDFKKAVAQGEKWQKDVLEAEKQIDEAIIDEKNKDLQAESDRIKQKMDIPIVEDRPTNEEMIGWKKQCYDEDNEQEMRAERAAEAHNNHIPEWDPPSENELKEDKI